jgi:hypothetical protein
MEQFRVVESTTMGFAFEVYTDSLRTALTIKNRRILDRLREGFASPVQIEILDGQSYRRLSEERIISLLAGEDAPRSTYWTIGNVNLSPRSQGEISGVMTGRFAPRKLRSVGAKDGIQLDTLRIGLNLVPLTLGKPGDTAHPIPLVEQDISLDITDLDSRMEACAPIRPGVVVSAKVSNLTDRPMAVALVFEGVQFPEEESPASRRKL